jgi:hypothetical protein
MVGILVGALTLGSASRILQRAGRPRLADPLAVASVSAPRPGARRVRGPRPIAAAPRSILRGADGMARPAAPPRPPGLPRT